MDKHKETQRCIDCTNYLGNEDCASPKHSAVEPTSFENRCSDFKRKPKFTVESATIRTFETGATRDTDQDKLNYVKALSPIVIDCYINYLGRHRKQPGGSMRDWDNWKSGIPKDVYLESQDRHHRAVWKLHQGFPAHDNYGPVTLKDSLCGVIFNAMGFLHEILKEEMEPCAGDNTCEP